MGPRGFFCSLHGDRYDLLRINWRPIMVRSSSPPAAANDHRSGFGTRQEVAAYLKVPERPSTSGLTKALVPVSRALAGTRGIAGPTSRAGLTLKRPRVPPSPAASYAARAALASGRVHIDDSRLVDPAAEVAANALIVE